MNGALGVLDRFECMGHPPKQWKLSARRAKKLLALIYIAGYTTVMYEWKNDDGSNMNARFQNGGLVNKAQFGLQ